MTTIDHVMPSDESLCLSFLVVIYLPARFAGVWDTRWLMRGLAQEENQ